MKNLNPKRREILDWAKEHGWVINPSKGMELYVENWIKFRACACDAKRKQCPCLESIEEVMEGGHCLCRLYWKDLDTFRSTLKVVK